jgi:hypothetical protein
MSPDNITMHGESRNAAIHQRGKPNRGWLLGHQILKHFEQRMSGVQHIIDDPNACIRQVQIHA